MKHSQIGASSMHRWSICAGSVRLASTVENRSSAYAAEGTVAHELAAEGLLGRAPDSQLGTVRNCEGFEIMVTQEMIDAVKLYLSVVEADRGQDDVLHVEQKFDLSKVYPGLFGTADAVIWKPAQKLLIVKDFKYGAGVPVDVKANPQLLYYALGALVQLGYPARTVRTDIVQPRCPHPDGPVRSETIDAIDLLDFATDLIDYAKATEDENAPLVPGEHCRFCPAAGICPELHAKAQNSAVEIFSDTAPYDPKRLAETLGWLPTLEAWIKSVREFAYAEAEAGRTPPGWKLVAKRAVRRWRSEGAAALELDGLVKADELYEPRALKSPAQIERLLPKDQRKILEELTTKESSGHTLAPDSDSRPAVKEAAADAFSNV